jgi:phosphoglycolate phosphatase
LTKLFLFDVDWTLVNSGGAGGRAMNLAFAKLFGIEKGFANIEFTGRTDRAIFREAVRLHGLDDGQFPSLVERFLQAYSELLAQVLPQCQGYVLPGIPELLAGMQAAPTAYLGLATGNFQQGARLKLEHYGVYDFFVAGGFGDDSEVRADVVRVAIERLAAVAGDNGTHEVYVIGDTPLDIEAARANGARPVAVATGSFAVQDLRDAGAEMVFPDFSRWQDALSVLLG